DPVSVFAVLIGPGAQTTHAAIRTDLPVVTMTIVTGDQSADGVACNEPIPRVHPGPWRSPDRAHEKRRPGGRLFRGSRAACQEARAGRSLHAIRDASLGQVVGGHLDLDA